MKNTDKQYEAALRREAAAWNVDLKLPEPTELAPDAPAPRLQKLIDDYGAGPSAQALRAWQARMMGGSILEVAASLGLSVSAALVLLKEVGEAVTEDLKEAVELNRSIDLARIDALISTYLPRAKEGRVKSAHLVLKCLERRSKLIGLEPLPAPTRSTSQSVLIWIQEKLPAINTLVESMPLELPPSPPS